MPPWSNFFVAIAGAAATLTGLIFVGVSISLAKILSLSKLPDRALQALLLLLTVLVTSSLCLIPGLSANAVGIEVLSVGIIVWPITLKIDMRILNNTDTQFKKLFLFNIVFTQLAILPYIISGIVILCTGFNGVYWLVPGIIFSLVKAVIDAWVLLVEIHR